MLQQVAASLTETLLKKKIVGEEDREIYIYGFEAMLSTVVNSLLVFAIGLLTDLLLETAIFLVSFAILRVYCGGYHAKTHFGCILTFVVIYGIAMTAVTFCPPHSAAALSIAGAIVSLLFVLRYAPIEHKNRPFVGDEFKKFRLMSRVIAFAETGAVLLISLLFPASVRLASVIAAAMISVMFILALAKIIERKR